ncbi:MAG TPA: hypothetical protein VKB18_07170 [Gemmatimonadota bacterium]|nr:hypothetical protein [Gemmatimonadota bacterium]
MVVENSRSASFMFVGVMSTGENGVFDIGNRLRRVRDEAGVSTRAFAFDVDPAWLLTGRRRPGEGATDPEAVRAEWERFRRGLSPRHPLREVIVASWEKSREAGVPADADGGPRFRRVGPEDLARRRRASADLLEAARPVVVLGPEHYARRWHDFLCTGAPIHGPDGEVVGAVDVSTTLAEGSPSRLGLVAYVALAIERSLWGNGSVSAPDAAALDEAVPRSTAAPGGGRAPDGSDAA